MKNHMPEIDLGQTDLTGRDLEIASMVLKTKSGSANGTLRATKPKKDGEASYVWRMVAFQISPISQHHCMPVTADFDLPSQYWDKKINPDCHEARRSRIKELDVIVDKIVAVVPRTKWHGIQRWTNALYGI